MRAVWETQACKILCEHGVDNAGVRRPDLPRSRGDRGGRGRPLAFESRLHSLPFAYRVAPLPFPASGHTRQDGGPTRLAVRALPGPETAVFGG